MKDVWPNLHSKAVGHKSKSQRERWLKAQQSWGGGEQIWFTVDTTLQTTSLMIINGQRIHRSPNAFTTHRCIPTVCKILCWALLLITMIVNIGCDWLIGCHDIPPRSQFTSSAEDVALSASEDSPKYGFIWLHIFAFNEQHVFKEISKFKPSQIVWLPTFRWPEA